MSREALVALALVLVGAGAAGLWWALVPGSEPVVARVSLGSGQPTTEHRSGTVDRTARREDDAPDGLVSSAQAVSDHCGLDVVTACNGRECAAVSVVPNLSSVWGWASLATQSPRFVATQALIPLGIQDACVVGAQGLMAQGTAVSRYDAQGREVWCVSPDLALCDRAAARIGSGAVGFVDQQERLRHLRLD